MRRVDVIPPSLAIAQAILESGWGTSRFAQEGNALYGQWVWGDDSGMTPLRPDSSLGDYGVQSFSSLLRSAVAYMRNLNTSNHYAGLRAARVAAHEMEQPLDGCTAASYLSAYAAIGGEAYKNKLCTLIQQNDLAIVDSALLAAPPTIMLQFSNSGEAATQ